MHGLSFSLSTPFIIKVFVIKSKQMVIRLIICSLMIIIGTIIYVRYRHDIIFFNWIPDTLHSIAPTVKYSNSVFQDFIIYCLPDGLWYSSLIVFQDTFRRCTLYSKIIFGISILLPFVWEFSQLCDRVPGTFDLMDILAYILALLLSLIIIKLPCLRSEETSYCR